MEPVNVGELMLQLPGHFIAELGETSMTQKGHCVVPSRRISALPGDRNLSAHRIYFLLPMHRLNSRLSSAELRGILAASRVASLYISAPSSPTVEPLSSQQLEKAIMSAVAKERELRVRLLHTNMSNRCRYTKPEDKLNVYEQRESEVRTLSSEDDQQSQFSLQRRRSLSRHRSTWAPSLNTITELTV
ncbi:hypothetical protein KP509_16G045200 [Ceratopteris richardii]|nr:hypothetical protein KP509_16G045200 [Ceratopteris richardii]